MKKIIFISILLIFSTQKIYSAALPTPSEVHEGETKRTAAPEQESIFNDEDYFYGRTNNPIIRAVMFNYKDMLKNLIEIEKREGTLRYSINDTTEKWNPRSSTGPNFTALLIAAAKGYVDLAEILLKAGADPFLKNWNDKNFYDIIKNKPQFKEILEKYPADKMRFLINIRNKHRDYPTVRDVAFKGQKGALYPEYLGFAGVPIRENPTIRELIEAVTYGRRYKVKEIIEKIPQKELDDMRFTYNENGQTKKITLQMLAAIEDKPDILLLLLQEKNLDPSQKDSSGKTLFDYAFEKDIKGNFLRPHVAKALNEHRQELVDTMIKLKGLPKAVAEHLIGFLIPAAARRVPTTDPIASPAVPDDEQQ